MGFGEMRQQFTIEYPATSSDSYGGKSITWTTQVTVFGKIEPASASERFFAGKEELDVSHKITTRYRNDVAIDATMRVNYGGRIFYITGVRNVDELNRFFEILAREETK